MARDDDSDASSVSKSKSRSRSKSAEKADDGSKDWIIELKGNAADAHAAYAALRQTTAGCGDR